MKTVSSCDDPDAGEGNVVNQVEYEYNGWGRLAREYQEHDGAVDQYTQYVDYVYSDGASGGVAKYLRLSQVTYTDGHEIHYGYGAVQAIDDIMSRLATIGDGTDTYASYKYLGAGRIVVEDYEDIGVDRRVDRGQTLIINFKEAARCGRMSSCHNPLALKLIIKV